MGGSNIPLILPDCPGCGIKKGCRTNSTWGHNILVCSEECGFAVAKALEDMHDSETYKFLMELKRDTDWRLEELQETYLSELREEKSP